MSDTMIMMTTITAAATILTVPTLFSVAAAIVPGGRWAATTITIALAWWSTIMNREDFAAISAEMTGNEPMKPA
jgi:hypothetical protein